MGILGSIVGGLSLGGGGGLGSLAGKGKTLLFGEDAKYDPNSAKLEDAGYLRDYIKGALGGPNRQAPQAGMTQLGPAAALNGAQQDQFRQMEMAQANRLGAIASGNAKGPGELAVDRAAQRGMAQQAGLVNMARGQNAATLGRAAARNAGDLTVNAAGQAQQAALSDRMAAEQALQGTLGQGRGADLSLAGQNAAFQQQTNLQQGQMNQGVNLANLQSQLAQTGMDDARQLAMLSQLFGVSEAEMRARLGQEASFNQNRGQGLINTLGPALIGLAGGGGAGQQQRSG